MANVPDPALFKTGQWPRGVNNLAAEGRMPLDEFARPIALREAVNVDLTTDGYVRRRAGSAAHYAGTLTHSLWGDDRLDFGLFVDGGALHVLHADGSTESLGVTVGLLPLSYAFVNDRVLWSNRTTCGCVTHLLEPLAWAPEQPSGQPLLEAVNGYGLAAGEYQVAVTFTDAQGRESGTSVAAMVRLEDGQGIALSSIPQPTDALATPLVSVYCTGADDPVLYRYTTLPAGTSSGVIAGAPEGRTASTQLLQSMPPGQIVRVGGGRQWVASGRVLYWSEPLRYGLYNPARNQMRFNADIDVLEFVGDGGSGAGLYVAAGTRTYWLSGSSPADWNQTVAVMAGAVPGSSATLPGDELGLQDATPTAVWLSRNGDFYAGQPGGQCTSLTAGVAVDDADRAAVLYRKSGGIRQYVAALRAPRKQGLAVTDRAYAHVIHKDCS